MSADTGYAGVAVQDIQVRPTHPLAGKHAAPLPNRARDRKAQILDMLRDQRPAPHYTGRDKVIRAQS
jgi:hypothetical protein